MNLRPTEFRATLSLQLRAPNMPGTLACILSYGLTCTPAKVEVVEAPPSTPLAPATTGPASPPAKQGEATLLLTKVQSFYSGTVDLRAAFTQTYEHAIYGTKTVSKGELRAKKPGLMVWDYESKSIPDVWVNGKNLFAVEHGPKQVIRTTLANQDIAGAEKFLFGGKELTTDYKVKIAGAKSQKRYTKAGQTAVRMRPKQKNPHYKDLMLVVEDATGRVVTFVVLNYDKSTNRFDLSGLKRNIGLSDAQLKFKKPAGYAEIKE